MGEVIQEGPLCPLCLYEEAKGLGVLNFYKQFWITEALQKNMDEGVEVGPIVRPE